ncbi:sulfurtransferase complex subunit TusB [Paraglaciecola arctica]|uniref:tRNA 2-thiouridine synthesizing protein B n=1 Tax=Paraglaciecola arctica BSs20135 TaxID=493475 RepID=K6Y2Y8_9ALTE|nr:sulfurtransferase complex subunit TusB [Paraglaciecola arctica]GAC18286.1 tRNA 2-thiouridine synthesizing protein B [Paraglaciecola arctica BSs20135]
MILHKISTSPFTHLALEHCLLRLHSSDGLLLTQDAVYGLRHQSLYSKLSELRCVYVLKEDAHARGVAVENDKIQLVDYAEFVELSLEYEKVMSW